MTKYPVNSQIYHEPYYINPQFPTKVPKIAPKQNVKLKSPEHKSFIMSLSS